MTVSICLAALARVRMRNTLGRSQSRSRIFRECLPNRSVDSSTDISDEGRVRNISDVALPLRQNLGSTAPLIVIAGACMNSGKTYAATEIIQLGTRAGLRVAAAKLSGIACLRDTLNMADHGAIATASFLDCGLPSTVGAERCPTAATIQRSRSTGPRPARRRGRARRASTRGRSPVSTSLRLPSGLPSRSSGPSI